MKCYVDDYCDPDAYPIKKNNALISKSTKVLSRWIDHLSIPVVFNFLVIIAQPLPQDRDPTALYANNELDLQEIEVYGFDYDYHWHRTHQLYTIWYITWAEKFWSQITRYFLQDQLHLIWRVCGKFVNEGKVKMLCYDFLSVSEEHIEDRLWPEFFHPGIALRCSKGID